MSTYNLDFSLTTEQDRCNLISQITSTSTSTYTPIQYTQMADYILLASNKNHPDLPFVYPEEFSNPKRSHNIQSLDELMDNPLFDEQSLSPIQRTIYKITPRTMDRDNHSNIPNMELLWNTMDKVDIKLKNNPNNYNLKRMSIELHKQQYTLLETALPQFPPTIHIDYTHNYFKWHMGILLQNGEYADLDLCQPQHMAKFLYYLPELIAYCQSDVTYRYLQSDLYWYITDTFAAIDKANLCDKHKLVLNMYWSGASGKAIIEAVDKEYHHKYNQSQISIMFNKTIATLIAEEYAEIYHSKLYKNNPNKWRICLCCKQKKLLSPHNFGRFSNKPGGYSLICKECAKAKRRSSS